MTADMEIARPTQITYLVYIISLIYRHLLSKNARIYLSRPIKILPSNDSLFFSLSTWKGAILIKHGLFWGSEAAMPLLCPKWNPNSIAPSLTWGLSCLQQLRASSPCKSFEIPVMCIYRGRYSDYYCQGKVLLIASLTKIGFGLFYSYYPFPR